MYDEENNQPKTFDGFVDSIVYDISNRWIFESLDGFTEDHICEVLKGESMDLLALGNFYMEEEHTIYTYDKLEPYIKINTEDKDNR